MKSITAMSVVVILLVGQECHAQYFPNPYMVLIQQCNDMKAQATAYRTQAINQKNQALTTQATMPNYWNYYNTQIDTDPNIPQYQKDLAYNYCVDADFMVGDAVSLLVAGNGMYTSSIQARNNGDAAFLLNDYGGALSWYVHARDDAMYSLMLYTNSWMIFWEAGSVMDDLILIKNSIPPTIPMP